MTFHANGVAGLTLGAIYKSAIEMNYDHQLIQLPYDNVFRSWSLTWILLPNGDTLEQPAEYGVGIAYEMGQHTIAFDYKKKSNGQISTEGYKDFGWDDSDV